ncbi:MAG: O-antigen ligase family protein [Candidatus Paceibacterota bacterium]
MKDVNDIIRYAVIGLVMLVPAVALIVANDLFFPYITGKNIMFRVLVSLALAGWLLLAAADPRYRPHRSPMLYALLLFVLVVGLADLFGISPAQSLWSNFERMEGFVTILHLLAFFVVASSVLTTERLWSWFFHISIGISVIVGLHALGGDSVRASNLLGNSIYVAIYMLFHAFLACLFLVRTWGKHIGYTISYGAIIAFLILIMMLTDTRGTMLGLLVGFGVMALIVAVLGRGYPALRKIALGVVALGLITAIGFASVLTINNAYPDVAEENSFVQAVNDVPVIGTLASINLTGVNSGTTRLYIWGIALQGLEERPVLGWGQENFGVVFDKNYDPILATREQWFDRAHNTFVDWLSAAGILGLLTYVSLYGVLLWLIWRDPSENWPFLEKVVLTGMVVAYAVHNLFVFDSITSYILFFVVMAYVARQTASDDRRVLAALPAVNMPVYSVVASLALVGVIASIYMTAYRPYVASNELLTGLRNVAMDQYESGLPHFENALAYAERGIGSQEIREQIAQTAADLINQDVDPSITQGYVELGDSELEKHAESFPHDTRPYVVWGQMLTEAGQFELAEERLLSGLETSPHKQMIMFQLMSIHVEQGQYEEAVEWSKRAFELNPDYDQARIRYAIALRYAGEMEQAEEVLEPLGESALFSDQLLGPYLARGEYEELIAVRRQRVEILNERLEASEDPSVLEQVAQERVLIAVTYYEMGDSERAIQEFESIKADYPNFASQIDSYIERIQEER